jgi:hypothetical protein
MLFRNWGDHLPAPGKKCDRIQPRRPAGQQGDSYASKLDSVSTLSA